MDEALELLKLFFLLISKVVLTTAWVSKGFKKMTRFGESKIREGNYAFLIHNLI